MKIIFSRKGFDSANGGVASPIFPDDSMLSLPIPVRRTHQNSRTFGELQCGNHNISKVLSDLTRGKLIAMNEAHLDPDLNIDAVKSRPANWRPAFGQVGRAQTHLKGQGITKGDLFLYYGWFRRVQEYQGTWRYVPGEPNIHVIFGWLQIGDIWCDARQDGSFIGHDGSLVEPDARAALSDHPHIRHALDFSKSNNTVYIADTHLSVSGIRIGLPGAGVFSGRGLKERQLTEPGESRSNWLLPNWMSPQNDLSKLSYNPVINRAGRRLWTKNNISNDLVKLKTADIGQEFVLNHEFNGDLVANAWLRNLFTGVSE